jgi:hypothetical protein
MVSAPDASGSGNALTPLSRMHWANFIALSRLAAVVLAVLVSVGALEQPAEIKTIAARAASDRSVLVMPSLRVW